MDEVLEMCAVSGRCKGVCPEARKKRGQDSNCPAAYQKVIVPKKEKPRYDDKELME